MSNDVPTSWVTTEKDHQFLLERLQMAETVVFDLETTGLDEHAVTGGPSNGGVAARIVLASYTLPVPGEQGEPATYLVPLSHPESPFLGCWRRIMREHAEAIVEADRPLVGHNVGFDCRWVFATTGVDLAPQIAWDTRISSHLLDENASTRLKERAPDTFGIPRWDDDVNLSYPGAAEEHPLFTLGWYAARDTYWTWRLLEAHRAETWVSTPEAIPEGREEVQAARLGKVATWVSMPTTASLTEIEQRGFLVDQDWIRAELAEDEEETRALSEEMWGKYPLEGFDRKEFSTAANSKWFVAWTEAAVERGELHVAAMTPTGRPQWGKAVLKRQANEGSDAAQLILDVRHHTKRAEFLRSWMEVISPRGAVHTHYNAGSVLTGRLSSSSPNMQQVTKALRPAFIPREGFALADIDYSQIELRVAAFISRCEPMIQAFRRGEDLHRMLAGHITGKPLGEVTPDERQAGKSANFGLLYGMSPAGFREYAEVAYGVSMSMEAAEETHTGFFTLWEGMRAWHNRMIRRVRQDGYVSSPIGRVRRLPEIWDGNPERVGFAERSAINSPVQGFASDLMQMAAASIQGLLPGSQRVPGAYPVATVHDSIVVEVPEDSWEETTRACIDRMLDLDGVLRKMDCHLDVPLAAEANVGTRWGLSDLGVM